MLTSYADRSRVLTGQRCPRQRYFQYDLATGNTVGGVDSARINMDLLIGAAFHVGVENLLRGDDVDLACATALDGFWTGAKSKGINLADTEDAFYVYNELAALIEALIRAYNFVVLPKMLERFDVVEVEQEDVSSFIKDDYELLWGSRADALLMEKDSDDLYVLSLKTTKEYGKRQEDSAHHDMQGLSEVKVIDQRLQRWQADCEAANPAELENYLQVLGHPEGYPVAKEYIPSWFLRRFLTGAAPRVLGVIMQHALKSARRESPKGSGKWYYDSPLIRPYKYIGNPNAKRASAPPDYPYAAAYEFRDELGGNHRLGPQWQRENIWETLSVREWISILNSTMIQGQPIGFFLENAFVLPNEYYRNEDDMERWEKRMVYAERRHMTGVAAARAAFGTPAYEDVLDEYFPPASTACDYPGRCMFQEVCYGPKAYLMNPMSTGLYQIRTANHPIEVEITKELTK